jgi:predicted dehydrogenase
MIRAAIIGIGTGRDIGPRSIGYQHAMTYRDFPDCRIVGAADLSKENRGNFSKTFNVSDVTDDYKEMLSRLKPDVVSVCVWVGARREIVETCAQAGVRAIWCEKPFCLSMDDGRAMLETCEKHNVKIAINHQRRFLHAFQEAKRWLKNGSIGVPMEFLAAIQDWDLMEWGSHWMDAFRFFADDQPAEWVLGQVRCTGQTTRFGHPSEEHSVAYLGFKDGTRGLLEGGLALNGGYAIRLVGTEGLIDLYHDGKVRLLNEKGWSDIPTRSTLHGSEFPEEDPWRKALASLVGWMEGGPESPISGRNGLLSTELYLAAYESAKRRDRVDLPLKAQTAFPLNDFVEDP